MNRALIAALALTACTDVTNPTEDNEQEVITTVTLSFVGQTSGDTVTATWTDPENDGSPVIDPISLGAAEPWDLSVSFLNELSDPPEDITTEVEEESDQHQLFFTGTATEGLLGVAYADFDDNGLPVGLSDLVTPRVPGTGVLTVTLRHLPPQDGVAQKTAGLEDTVATEGISAIPGETDASVDFDVTVTAR